MIKVLIMGAGRIGRAVACLLSGCADYDVTLADIKFGKTMNPLETVKSVSIDIKDKVAFEELLSTNHYQAVISTLPYDKHIIVAEKAREHCLHYFDVTEDLAVAEKIKNLAQGAENIFIPQCGLAPGFINIAANHLMQGYDRLDSVKLRVGALPAKPKGALKYALTWSIDGLVNQYMNPCEAIVDGKSVILNPIEWI
jgi:saccharopine dehydrogenase-like NADP-dependent oxidoreductase